MADVWYRRGTEALREEVYHTARKAFDQAVEIFPQHALAYARLAEADAELDDPQSAQANLLRVRARAWTTWNRRDETPASC